MIEESLLYSLTPSLPKTTSSPEPSANDDVAYLISPLAVVLCAWLINEETNRAVACCGRPCSLTLRP